MPVKLENFKANLMTLNKVLMLLRPKTLDIYTDLVNNMHPKYYKTLKQPDF